MLTENEKTVINSKLEDLKTAYFQLVSDFGPEYIGNYRITFDEIKAISNRQRITQELLRDYKNYIKYSGFIIDETPIGLSLRMTSRNMIISTSDAIKLTDSIKIFRDRAKFNGDIDNM